MIKYLALIPAFTIATFAGINQSSTDLWDISQGAQVTATSGVHPWFVPAAMFGDTTPTVETGNTVFADGNAAGFVHFIEWKTPSPILLTHVNLFAGGDTPLYNNEREFVSFTLFSKQSGIWQNILTLTPTHEYTFLDATTAAILSEDVIVGAADEFRAEFVQFDGQRGYDGPRVIELDGFGQYVTAVPEASPFSAMLIIGVLATVWRGSQLRSSSKHSHGSAN